MHPVLEVGHLLPGRGKFDLSCNWDYCPTSLVFPPDCHSFLQSKTAGSPLLFLLNYFWKKLAMLCTGSAPLLPDQCILASLLVLWWSYPESKYVCWMKLSLSVLCVVWRLLGRASLGLSELPHFGGVPTPHMIFTFLLGWLGLSLLFLLPSSLLSSPLNQPRESLLRKLHNAECSLTSSWWKTLTQTICDSVVLLRLIGFFGMTPHFDQAVAISTLILFCSV